MSRSQLAACIVAALFSAPAIASAQRIEPTRPGPEDGGRLEPYQVSGWYRGVVPGAARQPPRARRLAKTRHTFVTWPGFEMGSAGSRIFVQTTRPVTYRRADEPNRIVLVLEDTRIHLRNNRNPLVTEHFNTPVSRAFLRRQRRDTLLVIEMKVNVEPSIRQTVEGEYHFLFVEFPSGSYPTPGGMTPTEAPDEPGPSSGRMEVRAAD